MLAHLAGGREVVVSVGEVGRGPRTRSRHGPRPVATTGRYASARHRPHLAAVPPRSSRAPTGASSRPRPLPTASSYVATINAPTKLPPDQTSYFGGQLGTHDGEVVADRRRGRERRLGHEGPRRPARRSDRRQRPRAHRAPRRHGRRAATLRRARSSGSTRPAAASTAGSRRRATRSTSPSAKPIRPGSSRFGFAYRRHRDEPGDRSWSSPTSRPHDGTLLVRSTRLTFEITRARSPGNASSCSTIGRVRPARSRTPVRPTRYGV